MSEKFEYFIGIDWGCAEHQVVVVNKDGERVKRLRVPNSGAGLQTVVALCASFPSSAVGIETPRGALVETLLNAKIAVFHVNPKQSERLRDRHTPCGAKDDAFDGFCIADGLRVDTTDRPAFRRVDPPADRLVELQELARLDTALTADRVATQNRLREQLLRLHPPLLTLCDGAGEMWFWELSLAVVSATRALRRSEVQDILKRRRISRFTADQVVSTLTEPGYFVSVGTRKAVAHAVKILVAQLQLFHKQEQELGKLTADLLDELAKPDPEGKSSEHRDVAILRSMPGVGVKTAATMLAEVPQFLRDRNYPGLRGITGVAPVTDATGKRSGKKAKVFMRRACRINLRNTMHFWALNSLKEDEWKSYYAKLRAQGVGYNAALRRVGDRLLRVLVGALKTDTLYVPANLQPKTKVAA